MLKKTPRKIAFNTIYLISSTIINSILGFARQIFIANILGPSQFGSWNLIRVILGYTHYFDFGANTGVLYERPKYIGRGKLDEAKEIRQQGFLFVLVLSIVLTFATLLISFMPIKVINDYSTIIYFLAISIPLFSLINFYNVEARIVGNFKDLSISMIIGGFTSLIFTIIISMFVKNNVVEWVVISWLFGMFLSLIYLAVNIHISSFVRPNPKVIQKILLVGFTLSLVPIVIILFRTVDRWILTSILTSTDFGYYAFGMTIGMFLYTIPNTLGVVLSTNLIQKFGVTGDPNASNSMITVSIFLTSYLMAFISGGVVIIIPFLLNHFLNSYLPGENLIKIVIVANCALFALPIASNFLLSIQRKKIVFSLLALMIILEVLLTWVFALKYGAYGGAIAVLFVSITGSIFFLISTFMVIRPNMYVVFSNTIKAIAPFFLLVAISVYIDNKFIMVGSFWKDLETTILYEIYYVCLILPVALLFFWLSKTFDDIKLALKSVSQ